jgi:hypothetical protein
MLTKLDYLMNIVRDLNFYFRDVAGISRPVIVGAYGGSLNS